VLPCAQRHFVFPSTETGYSCPRKTAGRVMARTLQQQIIVRALELISDDSKWTGGTNARDACGRPCRVEASEAVRFCAVGALARAAFELTGQLDSFALLDQIETAVLAANGLNGLERESIPWINDQEGREPIVAVFQKALVD
jgi:hypothetical protein